MPCDSDEFDFSVLFPGISEEDLASLDIETLQGTSSATSPIIPHVEAKVLVEVEPSYSKVPPAKGPPKMESRFLAAALRSPMKQFRKKGTLSVSDITAPAWCEVQFEYGLQQRRNRPLESRPDSFVSREGNTISVAKPVAEINDKIMRRGSEVHKKLEKEVKPEQIAVTITSPEERWASRILDLIAGVESLLAIGIAREIPVFGLIHDYPVFGIIDELRLEVTTNILGTKRDTNSTPPGTPRKAKRGPGERVPKPSPSPSKTQSQLSQFYQPKAGTSSSTRPVQCSLHLSDTKTRKTYSMPLDHDTLPAQLQVMLYRRLLNSLLSTSIPFDFEYFWTTLGLDPTAPFSEVFLRDAQISPDSPVKCLDDVAMLWANTVSAFEVPGVDKTLRLVYRYAKKRKVKGSPSRIEEEDVAKAIEASLRDQGLPVQTAASNTGPEPAETQTSESTDSDSESDASGNDVIGIKNVQANDRLLDLHLYSVLEWWSGRRPPRGVDVAEVRRCNSCEYKNGCEWREKKALEISMEGQRRSMSREPSK